MVDFQLPLFAALVFLIISSPAVYRLTDGVFFSTIKLRLADASGAPTKAGLIIHALVVFLIVWAYLKTT